MPPEIRRLLDRLDYQLDSRREDVVRAGRRRYGRCEFCGNEPHHSTNGACEFRYNANIAADDVRTLIAEYRALLAASPAPTLHAAAPEGYKCSDCTIDGEACPTCYAAWWKVRHPNHISLPAASPTPPRQDDHEDTRVEPGATMPGTRSTANTATGD